MPMRVVTVMPGVTPDGGAEQSLVAMAPGLRAQGIDLHVVVLTRRQELVPELERNGVVVHDLSDRRFWTRITGLRELIRSLEPDLLHATLYEASVPAQLASIGTGVPVLISWASVSYNAERLGEPGTNVLKVRGVQVVEAILGRLSRSWYHAVTVGVGEANARALRVPPGRVLVGERGREDTLKSSDAPSRCSLESVCLPDGARMILAIGRQDVQKGYETLLPAFDEVAGRHPSAYLVIAGRKGSATTRLNEVRRTMRYGDRVRFLGHRNDVPALLRAADAVVCASWREGAAGALIEAMASRKPIVTVQLDGLVGVFDDGHNALVVPRGELATALARVLDDRELADRIARAGRQTFEERFTLDAATARTAEIFRSVSGLDSG